MKTDMPQVVRLGLAAILALGVAVTGCGDGDGGPGGTGGGGTGGGGTGGGGTGGGGTGGGGTGGTGGIVDISDPDTLASLVEAGLPLVAEITGVTVSSPPVLTFTVATQGGAPVVGVPASSLRGTFAKLVPGGVNDQPATWQSYINRLAQGDEGAVLSEALQATRDEGVDDNGTEDPSDDIDKVVDNGDGSYVFTYTTDVTNVTTPVPISWEPTYTTRAGIEIRVTSVLRPDNPVWDFVPNGSDVTEEKDISSTMLCNNCHQRLGEHGNGRFTDQYCVTCHNPGTRDPNDGESVDQAYMIHSIHASEVRGIPYVVDGDDFSDVTYPQDVRECQTCHNEDAAPQGGAWAVNVKALACGGCHANRLRVISTDATTGIATYGIEHNINDVISVQPDSACRTCHNNPVTFPDLITAERHVIPERIAAQDYQYIISDVTNTNVGQMPSVTFSVTKDGTAIDLNAAGGPFDVATWGGQSRLAVILAWPSNDYTNVDSGSAALFFRPSAAQPVSMNPLEGNCPGANCVVDANFNYTITSTVEVPAGLRCGTEVGDPCSLTAGIEGHPAEQLYENLECSEGTNDGDPCAVDGDCPGGTCVDPGERIPVTGTVAYYAISETGGTGEPRAVGVSLEKCASCHGALLSEHGANRNNNLELCATCHNANATDIAGRAQAGAPGETPIDFKTMIHGIHAANITVYGFGGSVSDYSEVTYPGELNNCGACHVGSSYYPTDPSAQFRVATTFISDNFANADLPDEVVPTAPETPERTATLANQADDLNRTANAAACLQCHTSPTAESHAIVPGGAKLSAKQTDDGTIIAPPGDPVPGQVETCVLCHGEGSSVADTGDFHQPWFPLP